jgi:hypothetical protein
MHSIRVLQQPCTASRTTAALALCLVGALGALPRTAFADITFSVNSVLDQPDADTSDGVCATVANTCTLRAAVMQANPITGNVITIALPAGTYVLTRPPQGTNPDSNGDLNIAAPDSLSINIVGAGSGSTIVDANHIDRAFHVGNATNVTLAGFTVRNGKRAELDSDGGGILADGNLTLNGMVISGNEATNGGGLYNGGSFIASYSRFEGNTATGPGGAIFSAPGSSAQLTDSQLSGNHAQGSGGAMVVQYIALLQRCSIQANTAGYSGGAFYTSGLLEINASTIASNSANNGGGIYVAGELRMVNGTVANNTALGDGGGIYHVNGHLSEVFNSTIVDNDADHDQDFIGVGGGVYVSGTNPGYFNLYNSILARNTVDFQPIDDDCNGPGALVSHARNLIGSSDTCSITVASGSWALLNSTALIGPLKFNGGPTQTIALLPGSNALNGGASHCTERSNQEIETDQRGYPRVVGGLCDIGAFEFDGDRIFKAGFE